MDKSPSDIQSHPYNPYEDEIELMDYLKVLWKWKYFILLGTLACAVVAAIISFNITKIYRINTVLAPGVAKVEGNGIITYIGSSQEIKTLIETGALEDTVLKQIKVTNEEDRPKTLSFKITTPKGSNALEVAYETPQIDLGLQILTHLNQALLQKFDGIVKYFEEEYTIQMRSKSSESSRVTEKIENAKNAILTLQAENRSAVSEIKAEISSKESEIATNEAEKDRMISEISNNISFKKSKIEKIKAETLSQIDQKKNGISSLKARINGKEKQITNLEKRIVDLNEEIVRISNNTDLLIEERNKFLASTKNENNILASVMYTTTIQQNISYLNTLRSTVNNVNHRIFEEKVGIKELENDVKDMDAQIFDLQKQSEIECGQILLDIEEKQAQKTNLQKQTTYKNQTLKSDIEDSKAQIESLMSQINSKSQSLNAQVIALESEKNYIMEEIKNLEFKKNYVQNIQILQPPKSSLGPIKPKKKLNVLLAGVVGLFLTVFLAFFIEYVSRHKDNEKDS